MSRPRISIRNLSKRFGDHVVLQDLNLDIMPGESMVVIGQSGIGKSVLIKCILGLLKPDAGEIFVDGEDWLKFSEDEQLVHMHRIGMLFQGSALFDSLPVWKNVAFALLQRGADEREARARAGEVLAWVGMPGVEEKMPVELSGGMMKRVGFARAICHKPDIIFFDEPTTGIDPIMADVINRLIRRLHREFKTTLLSITHDLTSAAKIGDTIAMLYQGRIHRQITPEQLHSDQDPVLRQFVEGHAEGPIQLQEGGEMSSKEDAQI